MLIITYYCLILRFAVLYKIWAHNQFYTTAKLKWLWQLELFFIQQAGHFGVYKIFARGLNYGKNNHTGPSKAQEKPLTVRILRTYHPANLVVHDLCSMLPIPIAYSNSMYHIIIFYATVSYIATISVIVHKCHDFI